MPKLKVVKEKGQKIYPITIVKGIYDTEHSQPLSDTLDNKVDRTEIEALVYPKLTSITFDEETGDINALWEDAPVAANL